MARPTRQRQHNRGNQPTQTEKEFENTFREVADAAGYKDQFHVIDRGATRRIRAVIADLRNRGLHEAAQAVASVSHSKVTSRGYPDYTLRHQQYGIMIAELKSDRKDANPEPEQIDWLRSFAITLRPPDNPYAPGRAHLWRPQHWPAIETQFGLVTTPTCCRCEICEWLLQNEPR